MSNYNPNQDNRKLSLDEIEEMEKREKKAQKKKFNIFDAKKSDKPDILPDEIPIADNPNLVNFFKLVGRKLNQLLSVNIMMIVGNFPIFFFLLGMSGYFSIQTTSPYYAVFAPLRGAMLFNDSPATAALWTIFSRQANITVKTTADYVLFGLAALVILTFGPVRVGVTYLIRNMFRGEPIFMLHDFFRTIKRNLRQAIICGVLDILIIAVIFYDILFFNLNAQLGTMMSVMFFLSISLGIMYFFMRHYIYLMLVTFDISIFKMYKNALLFTVLGLKRNVMLALGTVAVFLLEYFLLAAYLPLGVIVPFVILPSILVVMGVYAAYPKIKEVMIDPYYSEVSRKPNSDSGEEAEETE